MIQELKIKNCLSFKDEAVFSFEATKDTTLEDSLIVEVAPGVRLLRFAMVMGANGSGKSNLLMCFNFLNIFWNRKTEDEDEPTTAIPFQLDETSQENPCEVELKFWINGTKYWYQVKLDEHTVYEEKLYYYKSVQPTLLFKRDYVDGMSIITFNSILKISPAVAEAIQLKCLKNLSFFTARQKVNTSLPEIDVVRDWVKDGIMPIIDPETSLFSYAKKRIHDNKELRQFIIEYLRCADFNIVDIVSNEVKTQIPHNIVNMMLEDEDVPNEQKEQLKKDGTLSNIQLNFIHKVAYNDESTHEYPLSARLESYGTRRTLGIETAIYEACSENALLIVDEFETSMHPELMEYAIRRFLTTESHSQMLITTHYDPFLGKIDELIRKDCVWFTEKDMDGSTNLYPLVEFKGLNRMASIQSQYLKGKFGAIPNINLNSK